MPKVSKFHGFLLFFCLHDGGQVPWDKVKVNPTIRVTLSKKQMHAAILVILTQKYKFGTLIVDYLL